MSQCHGWRTVLRHLKRFRVIQEELDFFRHQCTFPKKRPVCHISHSQDVSQTGKQEIHPALQQNISASIILNWNTKAPVEYHSVAGINYDDAGANRISCSRHNEENRDPTLLKVGWWVGGWLQNRRQGWEEEEGPCSVCEIPTLLQDISMVQTYDLCIYLEKYQITIIEGHKCFGFSLSVHSSLHYYTLKMHNCTNTDRMRSH